MIKPAAVFSRNMVLQRRKPIAVWGVSDQAFLTIRIADQTVNVPVRDGKWHAELSPMEAGGPYTMTITGGSDSCRFENVMIGEVWLAGGQSNMELEIRTEKDGNAVLAQLTPDCPVRFYYTPKQSLMDEQFYRNEENTCWAEAGPESAAAWSAVGFHFAEKLAARLGVTVGVIGCNWGGTSASAWMSCADLKSDAETSIYAEEYEQAIAGKTDAQMIQEYDDYITYQNAWNVKMAECYEKNPTASWQEVLDYAGESLYPGPMGIKNEYRPGGLYETMLKRVCPYTLAGFLYYQGESDDHRPQSYYRLMSRLIENWRREWKDDQLPFLCVQLPMFRYADAEDIHHWCLIREAQMRVVQTVRNTGIAVIPDCGEPHDIHPKEKRPVGERLALQALYHVYGLIPESEAFGPVYRTCVQEGSCLRLFFDHAEAGFRESGEVAGFEVADFDGAYVPAKAQICGSQILVSAEGIQTPCRARYAWRNLTDVTVYGVNGIPLSPFRTNRSEEA